MNKTSLSIVLIILLMLNSSWGFLVHRTITQTAIYSLPDTLQMFFFKNMRALVKTSVDPDLRQKEDSTEKNKHFIDLDAKLFNKNPIPDKWEIAVKKYGEKKLRAQGILPWEIVKTKNKLTQAFKNKDKNAIILYAADLAHYVADAYVPLHTTQNYDGQLTNQKGVHSLWETECPQLFIEKYNLKQNNQVKYLKNIDREIWKIVRESEKLVPLLLKEEIIVAKNFTFEEKYKIQLKNGIEERKYSAKFIEMYNQKLSSQINDRLLKSTAMITNFWYTAWVDAQKPNLNELMTVTETDKINLQTEIYFWNQNQLIAKRLLRAKNGNN